MSIHALPMIGYPDLVPVLLGAPASAWQAVRVATRAEAMGLLGDDLRRERMADFVSAAFDALVLAGIARRDVTALEEADPADAAGVAALVGRVVDALEASPHPETEWNAVTARLGDELVGRLCHVSPSSLARYASGVRVTPDPSEVD